MSNTPKTTIQDVTITGESRTHLYTNVDFVNVKFKLKTGRKISFVNCDMTDCEFYDSNLSHMSMTSCTTLFLEFNDCGMNGIILDRVVMSATAFNRCDLRNSHIITSRLVQPIFESVLMDNMNLAGTEMVNSKFEHTNSSVLVFDAFLPIK